ncbi:MAG TPA: hypothetical protein VFY71_14155, partial [Planctomycetota bacterium]|nr:hypothetical protein [Planctomycetota bacterium]
CTTSPAQAPASSGAALVAADSQVAVHDSLLDGRAGAVGGGDGGSGLVQSEGFVFAAGTELHGGDGGHGIIYTVGGVQHCTDGGDGGHGVVATGAAPAVRVLDASIAAGLGGAGALTCPAGSPGAEVVAAPGVLQVLAGSARSLLVDATVCDRHDAVLVAHGQPFELLVLGVSDAPGFAYSAGLKGVLLLDAPSLLPLGTLDAGGDLALSLFVPQLPAAAPEAATFFLQAAFAGGGQPALGAGSALAVIKSGSCP